MSLNKTPRVIFMAIFAMLATAAFAVDMPEVKLGDQITPIVTWVVGLLGAAFIAMISVPLAAWGFKKVMGFLGR